MYDRILVPVDGSDEATRAAGRALDLASEFDAAVDVLHVLDWNTLQLVRDSAETERLRERGASILEATEEIASGSGQPVSTRLAEGKPAAEICAYAEEANADLIVMGRQGTSNLGERLLGGVTEHVLQRSDRPVFVVPGGETTTSGGGYSRVLLPTDGSENADAATPHARTIATHYGSTVHVLNVVNLQAAGGPFSAGGLEAEFVERLERKGKDAVERVADEITDSTPDVDVRTVVERTKSFDGAAAGIREYVADAGVDLIVVGSRGQSNLERLLLGSVTSTLLRSVDVPVLVVNRTA